jgi:uncharacterized repeat protein (TIGR01451 family)
LIAVAGESDTQPVATDTTESTDADLVGRVEEATSQDVTAEEPATDDTAAVDAAEDTTTAPTDDTDEATNAGSAATSDDSDRGHGNGPTETEVTEVGSDTPGPPSGDGVQPTVIDGNPTCLDVMASGDFLFEHKQDPPADATIELTHGDLSGTLTIVVNETTQTFDFTFSGDFVAAGVLVKGGPNANFYDYRPDGNAADTGLHAPVNPSNGKFYGLSHISFCIQEGEGTSPTPGIDVEKSCPEKVEFGADIEYTITVENTGDEPLVDVTVDDTLLGDITGDFDVDLSQGLAVGVTATAVVTFTPGPEQDTVINTVTAIGTGADSDVMDSDTATCQTEVTPPPPVPGIDVEKTCPATVEFGADIEYTITVENTGAEPLVDVTVDDTLLGDITDDFDVDLSQGLAVGVTATAVVTYSPGAEEDTVINTVTATGTGADSEATDSDSASCETDVSPPPPPVPAIQIVKDGPALVHRGDTITYEFEVTNIGNTELFDVELSDPRCDEGTIVPGADVDASLAVAEVWHFTCTHLVTDADPDPLPNTATVRGDTEEGEGGEEVTDTDDHVVDIIHPGIAIVKTVSDSTVDVGTTVTYTYVVTNTGDTTLFNVSVDDDVLGHIGTITSLAAGASATLTATFTVGAEPVINVGTATGVDVLGGHVTDIDDASVTPIAGTGGGGPGPGEGPGCCIGSGGGSAFTGSEVGGWALLAGALSLIGLISLAATSRRKTEGSAG